MEIEPLAMLGWALIVIYLVAVLLGDDEPPEK